MRLIFCSLLLLTVSMNTGAAAPRPAAIEAVRTALRANDIEAAVDAADKAVAALPQSAEAWHLAADAYGSMAQTASIFSKLSWAKKCRDAYLNAVTHDPRRFQAQMDLLMFYLKAPGIAGGGRDEADAQAANIGKLDKAWGHRAHAAIALVDKDDAAYEREALAAVAADPAESRHRVDLVFVLTNRARFQDAFRILDEGLAKSPDDPLLNYQVGRLAALSGQQLDRGLTALAKVGAITDKPDDLSEAGMIWRRAMILEKLGRKAEALPEYRRAAVLEPAMKEQIEVDIARVQK